MFKLDNDFLISLGLGSLPVDEKNKLLQVIYERLEMNVGMRLAEKMTDQQLDEFESFIDRNDEAGALRWLETNFPNYKAVVAEELEKLKAEVAASAPQILAAAQAAAPAGPPAGQGVPDSMQPPVAPGQPAAPPRQAYNPENPFQTNNPEFRGSPAGQSFQQPVPPQPFQPAPGFQPPVPPQQPMPPQPPVPPVQPPAGPPQNPGY